MVQVKSRSHPERGGEDERPQHGFEPAYRRSGRRDGTSSSRRARARRHRRPQPDHVPRADWADRRPGRTADPRRLAGRRAGWRAGDRAGLRARSSAEFVVGLLAASRAGLVVVPVDPALPAADQRARITAAGGRVVLVDGDALSGSGDTTLPHWPISVTVNEGGGAITAHLDDAVA